MAQCWQVRYAKGRHVRCNMTSIARYECVNVWAQRTVRLREDLDMKGLGMASSSSRASRRAFVTGTVASAVAITLAPRSAFAAPAQVEAEIQKLYAGKVLAEGKIKLDLPSIAENGLVVPLNIDVESPMSDADYVKALHIFADGNPNPGVASFYFTPMMPKASAQIRLRLASTQNIVAIAEMSDGKLFTAKREVKVTIGGCGG
jgi:sulfur-oxidizing protein SoxY